MARPKPAIPVNVPFHARVTQGEDLAIDALIEAWAEANKRDGRIVDRNKTAWFRSLVYTLAAEVGIEVVEPLRPDLDSPEAANKAPGEKG